MGSTLTSLFSGLGTLATSISTAVNPPPVAVAGAPGVIYNPQTGQLISTSSLTGSGTTSSLLIIGLIVIAALFLIEK
jgi:hypothetical protein